LTGQITPIGVGTATAYAKQTTAGPIPYNTLADPGNANTPILFEPPPPLTGGALEVWMIASGGVNWGGAQVWISTDGSTYALGGTVYAGGRQGVLTTNIAANPDPDTTDTLGVDLTEGRGQLLSGSAADANNFVTLCYCDGELISYETATLTAAYKYNLTTLLRRGVYGTPIGAHAINSKFARFGPNDASLFKYTYPASFIGQTIYIKLASFNAFGMELQGLAGLSPITFVLGGGGAVLPPFLVTGSQSGPTTANLVIGRFAFCSTAIFAYNFAESQAVAAVPATAATTYLIQKNGTTVGTMAFAIGATVATFTQSGTLAFNSGDVLTVVAPAIPDATLAELSWTLAGTQGSAMPVAEVHSSQSGPTVSGVTVARWIADNPVTFPAALAGSAAVAGIAATASATYTVRKNTVQFGTLNFAAGATVATFTGTATVFNPADILAIVAPASPDATLANVAFALSASNNLTDPSTFVSGSVSGPITANLVIQQYVFARSFVIPAGMAGSVGAASVAGGGSTAFNINRNGLFVGTMTFAGSAMTATFSMAIATTFNAGDVLTVAAPASPDPSLADLKWAISGMS
jgi:hypothetical protein